MVLILVRLLSGGNKPGNTIETMVWRRAGHARSCTPDATGIQYEAEETKQ